MSEVPVTIEHSVIIEADSETVFGFLIDPRLMAEWFGISHVLEAKAGGTFRVEVSAVILPSEFLQKLRRIAGSRLPGDGNLLLPHSRRWNA